MKFSYRIKTESILSRRVRKPGVHHIMCYRIDLGQTTYFLAFSGILNFIYCQFQNRIAHVSVSGYSSADTSISHPSFCMASLGAGGQEVKTSPHSKLNKAGGQAVRIVLQCCHIWTFLSI